MPYSCDSRSTCMLADNKRKKQVQRASVAFSHLPQEWDTKSEKGPAVVSSPSTWRLYRAAVSPFFLAAALSTMPSFRVARNNSWKKGKCGGEGKGKNVRNGVGCKACTVPLFARQGKEWLLSRK